MSINISLKFHKIIFERQVNTLVLLSKLKMNSIHAISICKMLLFTIMFSLWNNNHKILHINGLTTHSYTFLV